MPATNDNEGNTFECDTIDKYIGRKKKIVARLARHVWTKTITLNWIDLENFLLYFLKIIIIIKHLHKYDAKQYIIHKPALLHFNNEQFWIHTLFSFILHVGCVKIYHCCEYKLFKWKNQCTYLYTLYDCGTNVSQKLCQTGWYEYQTNSSKISTFYSINGYGEGAKMHFRACPRSVLPFNLSTVLSHYTRTMVAIAIFYRSERNKRKLSTIIGYLVMYLVCICDNSRQMIINKQT